MERPLLEVRHLVKYFPIRRGVFRRTVGWIKAVDDISFDVYEGETLGLVGESGCGKTTTGLTILRLEEPTSGKVVFQGKNLAELPPEEMRKERRNLQIIFQDPYSSLDPRMRIKDIVSEGLLSHNLYDRKRRVKVVGDLLQKVGLSPEYMNRFPHEFSGGQRQRIGIARALALNPKLIVCDEAVSALDVSIRSQVINLLEDLQKEFGLTYIFIAHDLSVIKHISDRIVVMYLGKIVEVAPKKNLFDKPLHPYTKALISAVPVPNPDFRKHRIILQGDVPSPANPPQGCRFHPRCPNAMDACRTQEPQMVEVEDGHFVACHLYKG
ncbi:MAG: ABC transporter ATP-binding protein [Synergistetes bacterium]|nr:ABC transporter ATP-binding protein [Synergistota bacterium]